MTDSETHQRRMQKLKAVVDRGIAQATAEKGLLIVHTGPGKGKSTAALGMLVRSLGHGFKCAVVQFIKGDQDTAETLLEAMGQRCGGSLSWDRCGEGFTWNTQDRDRDIAKAREGWERVQQLLSDPDLRFLLLDELNIVLAYGLLDTAEILSALQSRNPHLHVVVTGRGAPEDLQQAADCVTEMREIKHHFKAGIRVQAGIEF